MSNLDRLAAELASIRRQVQASGTPQLAYSSVEGGGAIGVNDEDGNEVASVGGQFDGSYVMATYTGPTPPTPSAPTLTPAPGGLRVAWDGLFTDADSAPMDFTRVEVHVSPDVDADWATADNIKGTFETPRGGELFVACSGTNYVAFVTRSSAGKAGPVSEVSSATASGFPGGGTDGDAPAAVSGVDVTGGIRSLFLKWPGVANADPVTYKVYLSDTTGFTPGDSTLIGKTSSTVFLAMKDGADADLVPDTPYFIVVVASDDDGDGDPSPEATGTPRLATNGDISADYVYAGQVAASQITAGDLTASVALVGELTLGGGEGARIVFNQTDGQVVYGSDGSALIHYPLDGSAASITCDLVANRALLRDNLTIQGSVNELSANSKITLASGTSDPTNGVVISSGYQWTSTLGGAAGSAGGTNATFRRSSIEYWNSAIYIPADSALNGGGAGATYAKIEKRNLDGSLAASGHITTNLGQILSVAAQGSVIYAFGMTPGNVGTPHYTLSAYNASGTLISSNTTDGTWTTYTEPRIAADPDGTNLVVVYSLKSNGLIYFRRMSPTGAFVGDRVVTSSNMNFADSGPADLAVGSFDMGSTTYLLTDLGYAGGTTPSALAFDTSGNRLPARDFALPNNTCRGLTWDATNGRFLSHDAWRAALNQHSLFFWDDTTPRYIGAAYTVRDDNATGGTHETSTGPISTAAFNKRRTVYFTVPPPPPFASPGADDPTQSVLYVAQNTTGTFTKADLDFVAALTITSPTTWVKDTDTPTFGTPTTPPPSTNGFTTSGSPAILASSNEVFKVTGSGGGKWGKITFNGDGTSYWDDGQNKIDDYGVTTNNLIARYIMGDLIVPDGESHYDTGDVSLTLSSGTGFAKYRRVGNLMIVSFDNTATFAAGSTEQYVAAAGAIPTNLMPADNAFGTCWFAGGYAGVAYVNSSNGSVKLINQTGASRSRAQATVVYAIPQ